MRRNEFYQRKNEVDVEFEFNDLDMELFDICPLIGRLYKKKSDSNKSPGCDIFTREKIGVYKFYQFIGGD